MVGGNLAAIRNYRAVEQLVARRAHNPKVAGSSPAGASRYAASGGVRHLQLALMVVWGFGP